MRAEISVWQAADGANRFMRAVRAAAGMRPLAAFYCLSAFAALTDLVMLNPV